MFQITELRGEARLNHRDREELLHSTMRDRDENSHTGEGASQTMQSYHVLLFGELKLFEFRIYFFFFNSELKSISRLKGRVLNEPFQTGSRRSHWGWS